MVGEAGAKRAWPRRIGVAAAVLAALAAPASASTDFTWSGQTPTSTPGASDWSQATNWAGTAPSGSVGTLTFPSLTGDPACTSNPTTDACYQSRNDISGLSASGISIDDGNHSSSALLVYSLTGNALTLGSGGLTAAPDPTDTGPGGPSILIPITLGAGQTWSIAGGSDHQTVTIGGQVTGSGFPLAVNLSADAFLALTGDDEVGAMTVSGSGASPGSVALVNGKLNATDGNPVSFSGGAGLNVFSGATGPLTMSGGKVSVGQQLSVAGAASLDSSSVLALSISQAGTTAGTDYSQLSATGNVNLGGATLALAAGNGSTGCPTLNPGDVLTLVTTSGSLSGTFSNAANGSTLSPSCTGGTAPTVRINYTTTAATATVLSAGGGGGGGGGGGTTTTTLLGSPSPASPVTNQTVTLTATVAASSGTATPAGTVEFDNGGPISGCTTQPLSGSGTSATATCQTSFAASSSPESLTATYTPSSSSAFQGSTSTRVPLAVGRDATTTALSVSKMNPTVGDTVIYTAAVVPAHLGSANPTGSVQFLDGGSPISSCSSQPLSGGAATCTISYSATGTHSITVSYGGDTNFTGSASAPPQTVTVQPPPPPPPPANTSPPTITGTAQQGQTLTLVQGAWSSQGSSAATITDQWQDCDSSGNSCSAIPGATGSTYTLTGSDVGHTIRVLETARNADGSTQASSAHTGVVLTAVPVNTALPVIGGIPQQGQTLTLSFGSWSPNPTSISDQWEDCDISGNNCTAISGATGSTYTLSGSDVDHTILVEETATNAGGTGGPVSSAPSALIGPFPGPPPSPPSSSFSVLPQSGSGVLLPNGDHGLQVHTKGACQLSLSELPSASTAVAASGRHHKRHRRRLGLIKPFREAVAGAGLHVLPIIPTRKAIRLWRRHHHRGHAAAAAAAGDPIRIGCQPLSFSSTGAAPRTTTVNSSSETPAPPPGIPATAIFLGGLDIPGYCRSAGFVGQLHGPVVGPGAAGRWVCVSSSGQQFDLRGDTGFPGFPLRSLSFADGCGSQYPGFGVIAFSADDNALSWQCWATSRKVGNVFFEFTTVPPPPPPQPPLCKSYSQSGPFLFEGGKNGTASITMSVCDNQVKSLTATVVAPPHVPGGLTICTDHESIPQPLLVSPGGFFSGTFSNIHVGGQVFAAAANVGVLFPRCVGVTQTGFSDPFHPSAS